MKFSAELFHLIGLEDANRSGRKSIMRRPPGERLPGSLLEGIIRQLQQKREIIQGEAFGPHPDGEEKWIIDAAFELCRTWIYRLFFLKLLETQLIRYHKGDQSYGFLSTDKIKNYHDLNRLFFGVVASKYEERELSVKFLFENVPYVNLSLFEPSVMERQGLTISALDYEENIPLFSATALQERQGKSPGSSLEYLLDFLNAYQYGLVRTAKKDRKTMISLTFLGEVLMKIKNYQEETVVEPGRISAFIAGELIQKAVVQKFNEVKSWNCQSMEEVDLHIEDAEGANQIINSIKICDPRVRSGDFLVFTLKELIALKSRLGVLQDRQGRPLEEYRVEVARGELMVTSVEGVAFEYHPSDTESQRVQEAIFHEKKQIINQCLFGVGIHSEAVDNCRWMLEIELLKSVYYKGLEQSHSNSSPVCYAGNLDLRPEFLPRRDLQTLPNLGKNIQTGNSLISRLSLDINLQQVLKKSKWTLQDYRLAIGSYQDAENQGEKADMEKLLSEIKLDWFSRVSSGWSGGEISSQTKAEQGGSVSLPESTEVKSTGAGKEEIEKREPGMGGFIHQKDEIYKSRMDQVAFEWRVEFPELLNENAEFIGFDVMIGNLPAVGPDELVSGRQALSHYDKMDSLPPDLVFHFYELGRRLLRNNGILAFIHPAFHQTKADKMTRDFVAQNLRIDKYVSFKRDVFDELTAPCALLIAQNSPSKESFQFLSVSKTDLEKDLLNNKAAYRTVPQIQLVSETWDFE